MKIISTSLFFLCLIWLATGCGSQQVETLEGKKAVLKQLKSQLLELNQQITKLEGEITELDPALKEKARRVNVEVQKIVPKPFSHYVSVQGKVEANQNITVSAEANGRLEKINVEEGNYVKKGQVLAEIDASMIQSQIEELETQLELAEITFEKQKNLWDQEIGTELQYLTTKNQKESLEKRINTLKSQSKYYQITAPISGTIDNVIPKIGETVAVGTPSFMIVNFSNLSLTADISENYVPNIKRGDKVKVVFPLLDNKKLSTRVHSVGQMIDPDNRTFEVEIKLPNDPMFKPNLFGELYINDRTVDNALTVPISVIQTSEIGPYVYVAEQNEEGNWYAKRKNLTTGFNYDGEVLVKEGLRPEDQLVTVGFKNLSDGQALAVNIQKEDNLTSTDNSTKN